MQRTVTIAALALLAATWRLWVPRHEFPHVPWFSWLCGVPGWWDWLALGMLTVGLAIVAILAPWRDGFRRAVLRRVTIGLFVLGGGSLLLLDQQRLQPWAYQFVLVFFVLAIAPANRTLSLLRVLTIGIYFWSGIAKLDHTFLTTIGPDLLAGLWELLALDPRVLEQLQPARLAWTFPLGELAVGLLLLIRRTRRWGLAISIAMHSLLIVLLGPWGLEQQPGVLIWNAYFIVQNILLFGGRAATVEETSERHWGLADVVVTLALVLPALQSFGWYDNWPAWAVYAPGAERVTLLVDGDAADQLPRSVRDHMGRPRWKDGRRVVRTDLWALEILSAPIYPQGRFRTAIALAITRRYQLGEAVTLVVESRANRWTGRRVRHAFRGRDAIASHASRYWINTRACSLPGRSDSPRQPGPIPNQGRPVATRRRYRVEHRHAKETYPPHTFQRIPRPWFASTRTFSNSRPATCFPRLPGASTRSRAIIPKRM